MVDWRPFEYVTYRSRLPLKGYFYLSALLEPTDGGARAVMRIKKPQADHPARQFLLNILMKKFAARLQDGFNSSCVALRALIETEAENRLTLTPLPTEVHVVLDD